MGLFNLFNRFATKKGQSLRNTNRARLSCEELESRQLLSTTFIEIHTTVPNALVEITFSDRGTPATMDDKVDFAVKDRDTGRVAESDSKPLSTLTDINIFTNAGNDRFVITYGNSNVARNGGRDVPLNVFAFGGSDTLELLGQSSGDAATPYVINGSEAGMHGMNCTFSGIDILKVGMASIVPPGAKLNFQFQPGGMLSEVHALGTADGVLDLSALSSGMTVNLKQNLPGQLYAQGIHTVFGGGGDDTLIGSDAADLLFGNGGADLLIGNGGDDVLVGGTGWDYLYGDAGRDILIGGVGSDWLEGGAGADIVINGTTTFDTNADRLKTISTAWSTAGGLGIVPSDLVDAAHASSINRQTVFDDNETDTFASRPGTNDTNGDKIFIEPPHVIGSRMTSSGISVGGITIRAISSFPVGLEFGGDKTVIAINWSL